MSVEPPEKAILPLDKVYAPDVNSIICRLCANPNDKIIGIFSEEGLSNELSHKMNLYLPIKVSENDSLPLQCCWNCASTVLAWHELVVVSVEADRRLRGLLEVQEVKPSGMEMYRSFQEEEEVESPLQEVDRFDVRPPGAGLSVFCQESLLDPIETKDLTIPKQKHHDANKKQYLVHCNVIADETILKYLETIQNPMLETTGDGLDKSDDFSVDDPLIVYPLKDQPEMQLDADKPNIPPPYLEDVKKLQTESYGNVQKEDYNFSCQYCRMMFVTEDDILNHVKVDHSKRLDEDGPRVAGSKKKQIRCHKLDQSMINAAKVVIEGRVYYNCKMCAKILHSPYTYIWHVRIHTGERPYVCDLCGKQFRISQGLVRHVKETHEGVKNFGCDICGRMFATRRNVQEHRRIHTNERPYVCDLCGKSFKQKASLFVHNRSHSDTYPFRCSYCNQGFRTRPPLLLHLTRHTGEKPYPCDVCGRFFRIKYELKRHKLIHSEEKPFSCAACGLNFRQKRYLKNHNRSCHKQSAV